MFYRDRDVLVTGGTGFVGLHLVQELLAQGARIRIPLHSRPLPACLAGREDVETVGADLTRPADCERVCRGMEIVFHAAGYAGSAGTNPREIMEGIAGNLVLTSRMLEGAWAAGVKDFLLFSSSTGYPASDHPVREEEMWTAPPPAPYLGYGWMRRYFEVLGGFVASRSGMKVAICRPAAIYGSHDNFDPGRGHVIPALIRRAVEGEEPLVVWGTGDEVRDFLHVSDLARGALLLLEKAPSCDPVNIGSGRGITIREIAAAILRAAGRAGARVVFDPAGPTTIPVRVVDVSKASRLLGFSPRVGFAEGIADTVTWYLKERGKGRNARSAEGGTP